MANIVGKGKLLLVLAIGIFGFVQSVASEIQVGRCRTERLRQIAGYTGISSVTDTLPDGCYRGLFEWGGYPLSVTVSNGEVSHIGVQLFTDAERDCLAKSPVYDFLERYLVEIHLEKTVKEFKEDIHVADRVVVEQGAFRNLHKVCGDTTLAFTMTLDTGRNYTVSWSRYDEDVFRVTFPASNRLLNGYTHDEGEQKLSAKIMHSDPLTRSRLEVDRKDLTECDSTAGHYHIRKGGYNDIPEVNNDRYYFVNDTIVEMLYGLSYPVESLSNLLISGEIENRFTAKIRMMLYGGKVEEFSVPLNSLINFFIDEEDCVPYFGLKGIHTEQNTLTALYEMVNRDNGYEHLMSVVFDLSTLTDREGEILIRLTPYIPTHDILLLYNN